MQEWYAVTECIPIYSGTREKPAIIIRQPIIEVHISEIGYIVKTAFFSNPSEIWRFWAQEAGLRQVSPRQA